MEMILKKLSVSFVVRKLIRTTLIVVGCLLVCFLSQGQKQYWNWETSTNISLDFSTNPPDFTRGNEATQTQGGAAISDSSGQLLFYGGGFRLTNRDHQTMPNGLGVGAANASTQSILIVPNPVVDSLYYVFTTDESGKAAGFQYSVVNMTKDNGRGDVTKKNVPLFKPCTEGQAAIRKLGDCGYWVVAHEVGNSNFRVYQVDEYGVNPAIEAAIAIQEVGYPHVKDLDEQIKFSQDGTMLAMLNRDNLGVELFDFDLLTGEISNPRFANVGTYLQSVEFSRSGKTMFVDQRHILHKFDLSGAVTNESLNDSQYRGTIAFTNSDLGYFRGLYLCPDDLVWVGVSDKVFFGQISEPDNYGSVSYSHQGFRTEGSKNQGYMNDFTVGLDWDNSSCNGVHPPRIDSTLHFYTYVTPNGDEFNDVFFIKNIHLYPKSVIRIFNSLGEIIFEEEGYGNNWSPSHLDGGTYYYQLEQEGGEVFRGKLTIVN